MWEFCVTASKNNENAILYIQENMQDVMEECSAVQSYDIYNKVCVFCLGAERAKSALIKQKLAKVLCNAVCEKMKYNYLKENILIDESNYSLFEAFIKVYTYFDSEIEKAIAIRAIYFPKVLNLESFLEFRLSSLKQKWKEMCSLISINSALFLKNETFLDLLKFLISNLDYKCKNILIDFSNSTIYSKLGKKLEIITKMQKCSTLEVLTKIIELSPQKIFIKNPREQEIVGILQELFKNRTEIIKN